MIINNKVFTLLGAVSVCPGPNDTNTSAAYHILHNLSGL